ncbi:MAG: HD domain-containing protein [Defluviitaleaceae bacterium]|nr:HD domain-containing protein [Defluviitaleaceae bacterium]
MPHFRDPVHGFIDISHDEQKIIDSAPFQRLRNIRQLATTYLIYHGAEHTRFGHSIGVTHLVGRVFDSVTSNIGRLFDEDFKINDAKTKWYRQILRLIALTHDLGHAPFSHAAEGLMPDGKKHEYYTKEIIFKTDIAKIILEIGEKLHKDLATNLNIAEDLLTKNHKIRPITSELLWMIYGEKHSPTSDEYIWPDFRFLKSFMDGELDCDKMDYLLRDSQYCGVTYGTYDLNRFISTLVAYKDKDKKILQLAVTSDGVQAFEEFVLARYFMFIQVYFHRTRRYFDRVLAGAMKDILPNGKLPLEVNEYLRWDDVRAIHRMKALNTLNTYQYVRRIVMSCVYESPAHADTGERRNGKYLQEILEGKFPNVTFYRDEVDKNAHKLLPTGYSWGEDEDNGVMVIDKHTGEAKNIVDESLILNGVIKPIYIFRIYTDASKGVVEGIRSYIKERHSNN